MKFLPALALLFLSVTALASGDKVAAQIFQHYQNANDTETRLIEYKDSDEALHLKLVQLGIINKSRKRFRRTPVELDILASRVANKMAKEAAENRYTGHWNMAGEKPYHRYAFAGGVDHVGENAYGYWISGRLDRSPKGIATRLKEAHKAFMAERAPNDGHKKQVLDKTHNFVGIGYYATESYFSYYEEFVDRYYQFSDVPQAVKPGERFEIGITPSANQHLYYLVAYYEKPLKTMTPKKIQRRHSYNDFGKSSYDLLPWDLNTMRQGEEYRIPLQFDKPGLYYIHVYQHKKALTRPAHVSTKGKTQASGIVIRVEE